MLDTANVINYFYSFYAFTPFPCQNRLDQYGIHKNLTFQLLHLLVYSLSHFHTHEAFLETFLCPLLLLLLIGSKKLLLLAVIFVPRFGHSSFLLSFCIHLPEFTSHARYVYNLSI